MSQPKVRLNVLRNGAASGGKVVLKPSDDTEDGFNLLLERCSAKFGAHITRLFNLEGFEVDDLVCIDAGDTLIAVPSNETFISHTSPLMSASYSTLSQLSTSSFVSASTPERIPSCCSSIVTDATSVTYGEAPLAPSAVTPDPPAPPPWLVGSSSAASHATPPPPASTGSCSAIAPAPTLTPPPPAQPHTHLTVLQAAPLTSRGVDGRERPLPFLSLTSEREKLLGALRYSNRAMSVSIQTATTDALVTAMTMGTTVLHWSGHGEESFMAFEDGGGGSQPVTPQLLASTCGSSDSHLKLVFVCACHSQPAANAFVRAGVQHVVAVRSHALILDAAAIQFTKHFYLALGCGKSVQEAFDAATTVSNAACKQAL